MKFHSGKVMTSADVKWTFERWLSTPNSPTSYTIKPIDHIDAPDPQTVVFTLSQPYNIFLDQIAGSYAVILNQESVDKAGKDYMSRRCRPDDRCGVASCGTGRRFSAC